MKQILGVFFSKSDDAVRSFGRHWMVIDREISDLAVKSAMESTVRVMSIEVIVTVVRVSVAC